MRHTTGYPNLTGDGIGGQCPPAAVDSPDYAKYRMQILNNNDTAPTTNVFYENYRAATSMSYYDVNISNTNVTNYGADHGFYISSQRYYSISVTGNYLWNPGTGISMNTTLLGTGATTPQFAGNLNINNNNIQGGYIGITVNKLVGAGSSFLPGAIAHVNNNIVDYANSGIAVNGYTLQLITTDTNSVILNRYFTGWGYGIEHSNCNNSFIRDNVVQGDLAPAPAISTSYFSAPSCQVGIYGTLNVNATVTCNICANLSTGFQFVGSGNLTIWNTNVMELDSLGLVLQDNFGQQGFPGGPTCGDIWRGSTYWSTGSLTHKTIHTLNFGPPMDSIYVNLFGSGTDIYDPARNDNQPVNLLWTYGGSGGAGNGLVTSTVNGIESSCEERSGAGYRISNSSNSRDSLLENIVTNPLYSYHPLNWIQLNNLYRMMRADSSYAINSSILASFQSIAAGCRIGWLSNIKNAIAKGDKSTALTLLGYGIHTYIDTSIGDDTTADYIVTNYITLYNKYLLYQDTSLAGADSAVVKAIANLCPELNGNVVFEARALYRILYEDDTTVFNDTCNIDTSGMVGRYANNKKSMPLSLQQYQLFPNPNDGSFTLKQLNTDNTPVNISVQDVLGKRIFLQSMQFINNTTQVQVGNVPPGVYLLQIADGNGKTTNFKFVVR